MYNSVDVLFPQWFFPMEQLVSQRIYYLTIIHEKRHSLYTMHTVNTIYRCGQMRILRERWEYTGKKYGPSSAHDVKNWGLREL